MPYTYRDIIRHYSDDMRAGRSDTDLSPRQRRMASVMLNLASNAGYAAVQYPPTDGTRDDARQYLARVLWDVGASALFDAVGPSVATDYSIAHERAAAILATL